MKKTISFSKLILIIPFIFLFFWAAIQLFPLLFMFISSLKTDAEIVANLWSLPRKPQFVNYIMAWKGGKIQVPIGRYFLNSVIVTSGTLLLLVLTASLAGYALGRYIFPGQNFFRFIYIGALAIPGHAALIPVLHFMGTLGLRNTYIGLIGVYTSFWIPFSAILMQAYFKSFPREIEDSCRIDGCSDFGVFTKIAMPMSKGAVATLAIINVVGIWSEFLFAFILMNKGPMKTLPIGIFSFRGEYSVEWGLLFAGLSITSIPTLIFFFIFQRRITKGMSLGAFR